MGYLVLPKANNSPKYHGKKQGDKIYYTKNYSNRYAVKNVIDDILRNRPDEEYRHELLAYGALGTNQFLSVEDMIATFIYVQDAYNIDYRRGRRMYHEVYWFKPEEVITLGWSIERMWRFAYDIANECYYKKGHQVIFAIHYDLQDIQDPQGKYHIHFAVNTVNYLTGAKLHTYKYDLQEREVFCNETLEDIPKQVINTGKVTEPIYFDAYKGEQM